MRNIVTTLIFAGASLLGTAGIVAYADQVAAAMPAIALHGGPVTMDHDTVAYAAPRPSLDQPTTRSVRIAAR